MKPLLQIWKSKVVQGTALILLNFIVNVILLTSVPGWEPPDWPWNLMALAASILAGILGAPSLLEGKRNEGS